MTAPTARPPLELREDLREHGDLARARSPRPPAGECPSRRARRRRRSRCRRAAGPARRCGCPCGAASSPRSGSRSRTRVSSSTTITPSPTRGALSTSISSTSKGNEPSAIIVGEAVERFEVGAFEVTFAPRERDRRLLREHGDRPRPRAASGCTSPARVPCDPSAAVSPSTISPVRQARVNSGRSTSSMTLPTRSCG